MRGSATARPMSAAMTPTSATPTNTSRYTFASLVLVVHPLHGRAHRDVERDTEALVGDHAAQLAARGLRGILDDYGERPAEAVPGAHRRRDHVQAVRHLLHEQLALPTHTTGDQL